MTEKEKFIDIFKANIKREGADKLLAWLEGSDFFDAPASTRFHLARSGGLLTHSLHVYDRLCMLVEAEAARNPEFKAPPAESLAICGLLHDCCKVEMYIQEPKNQKTYDPGKVAAAQKWQVKHDGQGDFIWETVMGYKVDDKLPYGHGEKSVYIISGFMRLSREEAMAIRWHMGSFDDSVKGGSFALTSAFGNFPLAVFTHLADMMATHLDEASEK